MNYKVKLSHLATKASPTHTTHEYIANVYDMGGNLVESAKFYGAEVSTNKVRRVIGGLGLRVAMSPASTISVNAVGVKTDLISAFAELQKAEVVSKDNIMEGILKIG